MTKIQLHLPIRLPSLSNIRYWQVVMKHKQAQKLAVFAYLRKDGGKPVFPPLPLVITITRIGPRTLDDDNLQGACKYVRDQIANEIGVDDGSPLYTWKYAQRKSKVYGVDIEICSLDDNHID